ncbi:MAG: SAM-dependent methyltransferase, partial [Candidatus Desulforudis sp.]|nr:SAM-dependent methyltransferase [Desulforudis sp.]
MSVVCYPGHPEGLRKSEAVKNICRGLPSR